MEAVSIAANGETLRQQQLSWPNESFSPAEKLVRRAGLLTDPGAYCDTDAVHVTTPGVQLKAKYILHTVTPLVPDKLRTVTDAALFSCYRYYKDIIMSVPLKTIVGTSCRRRDLAMMID